VGAAELARGVAKDGRVWRPQLAALRDEFTVVAWTSRGGPLVRMCLRIYNEARV
jgi:hypothetical protein